MPELPELAGVVDFLEQRLVGNFIARVEIGTLSAIKSADPNIMALQDSCITGVGRRGKFLLLQAEPKMSVAVHLSRGGWLFWRDEPLAKRLRPGDRRVALRLQVVSPDGEVVGSLDFIEAGTHKRLAIYPCHDPNELPGIARLGPEADCLDNDQFQRLLSDAGGKQLKTVLRDQTIMAGIGNAYSDEILWQARLSPTKPSNSLSTDEADALLAAAKQTLGEAVSVATGKPLSQLKDGKRSHFAVHARSGEPCPRCQDIIQSVAGADTSYEYCPQCQTGGRPLADRRMSRLLK